MTGVDYAFSLLGTGFLRLRLSLRAPRERPIAKVLIVGYGAIGDCIFFLPVLQALRQRHPKAKVTFIANRYPTTEEMLPATGLVDDIWLHEWEGPGSSRAEQFRVNNRIIAAEFDMGLLTLSSPAHYFQRGLASIPVRAGHCRDFEPGSAWQRFKRGLVTGEFARRAIFNRRAWIKLEPEHSYHRNLRLARAVGLTPAVDALPAVPVLPDHQARASQALPGGPWIGVHIVGPQGAYKKIWQPERFAEVCRALSKETPARFVIVGSKDDFEAAQRARKVFPEMVSLAGQLSLLDTFAVISHCRLFLSSDTGLAKAAMALGVPTATWWGPSDPREYGAVWEVRKHLDIKTGIWCSPCSRMGMAKYGLNFSNCGHHDCIEKLDVEQALHHLRLKYADLLR